MIDPEKIPSLLKSLGKNLEEKVAETLSGKKEKDDDKEREPDRWPPMRNEYMEFMEPDWDELDKKANIIVGKYALVSGATSILPLGLDVAGATMTFSKMATELAGIYQVIVSAKRARQMGWAIATTTGTVLGATFGAAYAAGKLASLIPGAGYLVSVAIQAPIVGAVAWAAGDALKGYFRECRMGREPSLQSLSESFAKTLHLKLKSVKKKVEESAGKESATATTTSAKPAATTPSETSVSDAVEKLASMHELMKTGAITPEGYEKKKAELLKQI
jgi:uncharacterized protein (DUF697 family)